MGDRYQIEEVGSSWAIRDTKRKKLIDHVGQKGEIEQEVTKLNTLPASVDVCCVCLQPISRNDLWIYGTQYYDGTCFRSKHG